MIIAHRGESIEAPENSLSAITMAWSKGVRKVEIDIRKTSDDEIIVIHDRHTGRIGNKKYYVSRSTLEQLKTVDIGSKKSLIFKDEKIPTLKEVLKIIPLNCKLIIELKDNDKIIPLLVDLIIETKVSDKQVEFIAFNLKTISKLKSMLPEYKMLWLLNLDYFWPRWLTLINKKKILKRIKYNNLDGINIWAGQILNKDFIDFFKKSGYSIYVWTVNEPEQARILLSFGIDSITTDRASWLKQQLEN